MPNKYDDIVKRIEDGGTQPGRVPLTKEQLSEFESWQGYAFPTDYRDFLRDYGGISVRASYPLKDARKARMSVFMFFDVPSPTLREQMSLGEHTVELDATPTMGEVLELDEDAIEVDDPPRELLPIAIDQGGNQVYLCLAGRHPGAIYLWMNWEDIYFVADSFDEFMQSLQPYD